MMRSKLPGLSGKQGVMSGSFSFEAPHVLAKQILPVHRLYPIWVA
jgi:hypothetical protein